MKQRIVSSLPVQAVSRFLNAQGPNWATIVAWNLFTAFFPIVLLVITVVGLILQDPGTRATVEHQVLAAFPSCSGSGSGCAIIGALDDFRRSTGLFAIVGFVGLVWTGAGLFSAIEQGLNSLYPCKSRGFVKQKVMSIGMVIIFTVMAVPLVVSGSVLSLLESIPGLPDWLHGGIVGLLIQVGAGIVDAALLFGVIYYVVPNRKQRVRDIAFGSIAAGILFEALTLLFPLYFKLVTNSPQWGQTFGLVFVLLFYFFLVGQITILGGAFNAERAVRRSGAGAACQAPGLPQGGLGGEGLTESQRIVDSPSAAAT